MQAQRLQNVDRLAQVHAGLPSFQVMNEAGPNAAQTSELGLGETLALPFLADLATQPPAVVDADHPDRDDASPKLCFQPDREKNEGSSAFFPIRNNPPTTGLIFLIGNVATEALECSRSGTS